MTPGTGGHEDEQETKDSRKSAATVLVEIAEELFEFAVTESGDTFGVPRTCPKVVRMLRGGRTSLRAQLAREYFAHHGKAAPQQALADALLVIEGTAQDQPARDLYLRVAYHGGGWWLDLGDTTGRAVQITGDGWTLAPVAPVLFRRTGLTAALPEPVPGGQITELWSWLNVAGSDRPLVLAWLVHVLLTTIPHTVLGVFGEHGSAKSTATKVLSMLLDPSPAPLRKPPRDADAWVTAASGSWVVALDNLSEVPPWLSDTLARAATGDGDVRRKLYTDGELQVFAFRRCVIINGIDLGALAPDLADRLVTVTLDRISEHDRRDEAEFWADWQQAHPRLLGALLDLAAKVNRSLPSVRLDSKPRMADYAKVLAAVDHILGTSGFERYRARAVDLAADGLSGNPVAVQMNATIAEKFTGTSAELLAKITPDEEKWRPPKGWPADARRMTTTLRRIAPPLRKTGWSVADLGSDNHDNAVKWEITPPGLPEKACNVARAPSQRSQPASDASECEHESGQSQDDEPQQAGQVLPLDGQHPCDECQTPGTRIDNAGRRLCRTCGPYLFRAAS